MGVKEFEFGCEKSETGYHESGDQGMKMIGYRMCYVLYCAKCGCPISAVDSRDLSEVKLP